MIFEKWSFRAGKHWSNQFNPLQKLSFSAVFIISTNIAFWVYFFFVLRNLTIFLYFLSYRLKTFLPPSKSHFQISLFDFLIAALTKEFSFLSIVRSNRPLDFIHYFSIFINALLIQDRNIGISSDYYLSWTKFNLTDTIKSSGWENRQNSDSIWEYIYRSS